MLAETKKPMGRPSMCGRCGSCARCKQAERSRRWYAQKTFEERQALIARKPGPTSDAERDRHEQRKLDPEYRRRRHARTTASNAIRHGQLVREPCEVCGAEKVEAHHDDYDEPLDVRWLCKRHHAEHHAREGMGV